MGALSKARRLARRASLRRIAAGEALAADLANLKAEEAKYLRAAPTTPEHTARFKMIRESIERLTAT